MSFSNRLINVHNFDPATSIPDLSQKVILITGGNQGVGLASVLAIAKQTPAPKRLYLAARSRSKFETALSTIEPQVPGADSKITYLELDLASFKSIRHAARQVLDENDRLDILMNNAGVMGRPPEQTREGYEIHFGTNHMGHALLTSLLLPLLAKTSNTDKNDVRIINLSSTAHYTAPGRTGLPIDFDTSPSPTSTSSSSTSPTPQIKTTMSSTHSYNLYGTSKLANILHAKHLSTLHPQILTTSIHPGRVTTNLLTDLFATSPWYSPTTLFQRIYDWIVGPLTVDQGALNQLWAAFGSREEMVNGGYYVPVGVERECDKRAMDVGIARKLWEWQEREFEEEVKSS